MFSFADFTNRNLETNIGVAKGAVGPLPPVGLDSDKIIVVHAAELN